MPVPANQITLRIDPSDVPRLEHLRRHLRTASEVELLDGSIHRRIFLLGLAELEGRCGLPVGLSSQDADTARHLAGQSTGPIPLRPAPLTEVPPPFTLPLGTTPTSAADEIVGLGDPTVTTFPPTSPGAPRFGVVSTTPVPQPPPVTPVPALTPPTPGE